MDLVSGMNLVDAVIDEIALEGLDGITLEALWKRLVLRFGGKGSLPQKFMEQVWDICLQVRELSFYQLEEPRPELIIFNRYDFVDPDFGIILEPDFLPDDIYPHCPIDDAKNGIKGSCATYYTRKEIGPAVKSLNVHEAQEKYGRSLVIVASQETRENALMDKSVCPTLDITGVQYCFLERVGRSRYHGEVTQGKLSLSLLQEDPRSLFYHRKFLLRHKLVTKQLHHQKSGGHSCSGSLLHLPRFFVERKPKVIFLAQKVIEILKSRENHVAEYNEIRMELGIENSIKKLFKTSCFQNVVKTDLVVPYRMLYPHAAKYEWQLKNNPQKEKMLRCVQLIDSNIDVSDLWTKDEALEDDDPFELEMSEQKYAVPFLKQANWFVEASGQDGLGQSELARKMGLPKLQARTFFRNLSKSKIVAIYMNDVGRQRITKFVSRKFEDSSRMSKQFKREVSRMRQLAETPAATISANAEIREVDEAKTKDSSVTPVKETAAKSDDDDRASKSIEQRADDKTADIGEITRDDKSENRDTRTFDAATKILQRYKVQAHGGKYKRTFRNIAGTKDEVMEAMRRCKRPRLAEKPAEQDAGGDSRVASPSSSPPKSDENALVASSAALERCDVSGLMNDLNNVSSLKNVSNVTYRLLRRANFIIEAIKEHRVIDDTTKLMKMITEEEEKEGYDVKIDKKSLIRLLRRLAKDGLVKNIKLTLSTNGKQKSLTFICDPSIDVNHTVIRSAVEQAKLKFCLIGAQKVETTLQANSEKLEFAENGDEVNGTERLNEIDKESKKALPANLVFDRKAGRTYGYSPKFIRMQTLHTFLFYLIYEHPGKPTASKAKMLETLRGKGFSIDQSLEKEIGGVFNTEVGWKMFVPPLPKHNGWPLGWALMCDILLRLPLSVFLKVHKVPCNVPELEEYRNHPIRKHLLVKDLPAPIRNVLLMRRKYIFSVHDVTTRLCFVGLLQFGPQRLKEKDKVFVYLNRNTELMDTTTSAAHYHKIEAKTYAVMKFHFTSLNTVDKYWYRLWTTCVNTRLGGRLVVQGKDIVLEELDKKTAMVEAIQPRTPEEAAALDDGHVPGDRMGAAGVDSAFFAHLKRNWNWESSNYPFKRTVGQFARSASVFESERDAYMSKVKPKPVRFTEFHGLRKITGPVTLDAVDLKKPATNAAKNAGAVSAKKVKKYTWSSCGKSAGSSSRQRSYVRRVLPRRRHIRPRVKYDEIDYSALQRMDKLRVDWDNREDNILLVCKVAMMYLCPNPRRQLITFAAVRDVLRSYSLTSNNKTSRACQRRLHYMLKKPQTAHSVTLGVEELNQSYFVNRRFGDIVEKLKKEYRNIHQCEQQLTLVFRDLVAYIAKKNYDISDIQSAPLSLGTSTVEEFALFHRVKYPTKPSTVSGFRDETTNDIHAATINSVIHSSMCCGKDRRSWAYQLFRIYQQYPEWLLRSAMAKIRADQMISVKKHYIFAMRKQTNACMPMSSSQYQLSSGYVQKFNTKMPYTAFKEAYEFYVKLAVNYYENRSGDDPAGCGVEAAPVNGGTVASVHDYINTGQLDVDVEIPQHIIMLDPELSKDDERYIRIARRYQDILRNIEHIHMDDILDPAEESDAPLVAATKIGGNEARVVGKKKVEEKGDDKNEGNSKERKIEAEPENLGTKDTTTGSKIRETETHVNTDTEAFESDREVNFEEDDYEDGYEEESEELEDEEDDVICFLDGTKIRLTDEDVERSGLKVNVEDADCCDDFCRTSGSGGVSENKKKSTQGKLEETMSQAERSDSRDGVDKSSIVVHASTKKNPEAILLCTESESNDRKSDDGKNPGDEDSRSRQSGNAEKKQMVESENAEEEKRDRPFRANEMIDGAESESTDGKSNEGKNPVDDASRSRQSGNSEEKQTDESENAEEDKGDRIFRVNEMIENAKCPKNIRPQNPRAAEVTDADKRCTRIALLKMREELNDLTPNDSHHAHEYFVLNMFKIFYGLQTTRLNEPRNFARVKDHEIPAELLPLNREVCNELINDLRIFAIFPKKYVSYGQFKRETKLGESVKRGMDAVYEFVREKREVGASLGQLATKFYNILGDSLYEILSILREALLVLRSGVKDTRYIHQKFADPWLIHSYKIMRLQKECMQNVPAGSLYVAADEKTKDPAESNPGNDLSIDEEHDENGCKKNRVTCHTECENSSSCQRKMQKSRTCLLQTKDIYRAAKQLDLDTAEEIRVVVRPWIRVDGALNRRVLDRMLGGVLAYCLVHPGVYLTKVQEKFAPALQPFHTKELVEMLVRLECLQIGTARKSVVTLFSKSSCRKPTFSGLADRIERSEEELIVEPVLGATLKFAVFLSNRTYTSDFLAQQ